MVSTLTDTIRTDWNHNLTALLIRTGRDSIPSGGDESICVHVQCRSLDDVLQDVKLGGHVSHRYDSMLLSPRHSARFPFTDLLCSVTYIGAAGSMRQ